MRRSAILPLLLLSGCVGQAPMPRPPTATLQELMQTRVDPAADFIWDSVGTFVTAAGTDERQPHTAAEWDAVQRRAADLAVASDLLQVPGRRVTDRPFPSEGPGVLSSTEIQQQLDRERAGFNALATALHSASLQVAVAARAHDAHALTRAGEALDAACEACHTVNWYPHQVIPALPDQPPRL